MLSEHLQSTMMRILNGRYLNVRPLPPGHISLPPAPAALGHKGDDSFVSGHNRNDLAKSMRDTKEASPLCSATKPYLLYAHIPFCERLCPYCSFNRFPFDEAQARAYFAALREEMRMVAELGYNFRSMYVGGGTPTILPDELAATIDLARELFTLREVSCETNPNHLTAAYLEPLIGRVQRLSVGAQSFSDDLLRQMGRFEKYGSGMEILGRLQKLRGTFDSLNVDMIFNFPSQTEALLAYDLAAVLESGCNQVTFYPLMASPAVEHSLARSIGRVNYRREESYYAIISEVLSDAFEYGSAWAFNARDDASAAGAGKAGAADAAEAATAPGTNTPGATARPARGSTGTATPAGKTSPALIDEYIIKYEEYPAIGSGAFSYLGGSLYVNTFSVSDYIRRIGEGRMSVVSRKRFSRRDQMRYRLMMQLFSLRLDKQQWRHDFGCSVPAGVPAEYAFFKACGAFATDDEREITLTAKGRYLLIACMRQFFIGVNGVRDEARRQLPPEEQKLLFD
ncbi:MAG: radical SAM protein [Coriobacteriales bacterium]|jgi:coproporphyrinogen III oxidase-like Fe-S oxidoreductase|nr:radical SAM protein [Coriobacteriales bacterium]